MATGWGQDREEQVGTCPGDSTEQRPRSAHLEGPLRVTWMDTAHVKGEWTLAMGKQGHNSSALRSWKLHRERGRQEGQRALQAPGSLDLLKHPRAWELSFSTLRASNRKEQGGGGAGGDQRSCKHFPSTSGVSKGPPSVGTTGCNPGMPLNAEIPRKVSKGSGREGRKDAPGVGGHRHRTPSH